MHYSHTKLSLQLILYCIHTYIVPGPPDGLGASLYDGERLPGGAGVPELDGGVVAAGGQLALVSVAPVNVVDPGHVGCDVAPRRGRFLGEKRQESHCFF